MKNLFDQLFLTCVNNELINVQQLSKYLNKSRAETMDIIREVNSAANLYLFTEVKAKLFIDSDFFNDAYDFQDDEIKTEFSPNKYVTNYGVLLVKRTKNIYDRTFTKYVEFNAKTHSATCKSLGHKRNCDGIAAVSVNGQWISLMRLVATYFLPNPDNCKRVKCKNGNTFDAHPLNLYWY